MVGLCELGGVCSAEILPPLIEGAEHILGRGQLVSCDTSLASSLHIGATHCNLHRVSSYFVFAT